MHLFPAVRMFERLRAYPTAVVVLLLGLALTAVLVAQRVADNKALLQQRFDGHAQELLADIKRSTDGIGKGMRGVRAYFQGTGADGVTQQGFVAHLASRDIPREFPGLNALAFHRRVMASELPRYLERVRKDQGPEFDVHPPHPGAAEHVVLQVASDPVRYRDLLGLDSLADPRRAQAVLATMRSGLPQGSAPIPGHESMLRLPSQSVVVVYLAMYRDGPRPATDEAAVAQAVGVVSGVVEVDAVVASMLARHPGLLLAIDEQGADGHTLAVRGASADPASAASQAGAPSGVAAMVVSSKVFGRDWRFSVQPSAAWLVGQNLPSPALVALAGSLASLLLALLTYLGLAGRGRAALQALATQRMVELEVARHDLQSVVDAVPTLIAYYDQAGFNRFANRAYHEWFGRPLGSIPGLHLRDVVGEALYTQIGPQFADVMTGRDQHTSGLMTARDGSVRDVFSHYVSDPAPDGQVLGAYVVANDVTELTRSREDLAVALRENQALLHTLNAHALVSVADVHGRIVEVNDAFCALSGYGREELLGRDHRIVNSGTHPPEFWADMWRTVSAGQTWRAEVCNRAKSGALYWVDSVISPFCDHHGRVQRYVSIRTNITATKDLLQRMAQSEARFRTLADNAPLGVFATDAYGGITYANTHWRSILGLTHENSLGDDWQSALDPTRAGEFLAVWRRSVAYGEFCNTQISVSGPNATVRHAQFIAQPLTNGRGVLTGFVGSLQDTTDSEAAASVLRAAQLSAEQASSAKSSFLANMSHEIRTPLNAIVGLNYLLAQKPLATAERELVRGMGTASDALLEVINDVLDISKIESGELRLESAAFQPSAVLFRVTDMMSGQAAAKGLRLKVDCDDGAHRALLGDASRLGQVLTNLLSNAIKFTASGTVAVRMQAEPSTADSTRLTVEVRDSGIGMSAEVQQALYKPFMQADDSTTRRFGGTGLGLSIVHQLVQLMGGHISVESAPGQGSQFSVSITLPDAPQTGAQTRSLSLRGDVLQLVVADDEPSQRALLAGMAEQLGWSVAAVGSGQALVDAVCERHRLGLRTDAVVVDWAMPGLDGLAALARLHEALSVLGEQRMPSAVAISVHDLAALRKARHAELAANFLVKPFDRASLYNAVAEALSADPPQRERLLPSAAAMASDVEWLSGVRVMLVDDSQINLDLAGRLLQHEGAIVTRCANADDALSLLGDDAVGYDAVLMDLQMPGLDGFDATRRIRGELGLSHCLSSR
jgi:PAS domain S-box-containing protein